MFPSYDGEQIDGENIEGSNDNEKEQFNERNNKPEGDETLRYGSSYYK